jgi:hypothetical protein
MTVQNELVNQVYLLRKSQQTAKSGQSSCATTWWFGHRHACRTSESKHATRAMEHSQLVIVDKLIDLSTSQREGARLIAVYSVRETATCSNMASESTLGHPIR